jgi:ABC-type amino acid transport substrate-binding protein
MDGPAADALVAAADGFLVRLDEDLGQELYALAVPKGRPELLAQLDAALKRLVATGTMEALDLSYELRSR